MTTLSQAGGSDGAITIDGQEHKLGALTYNDWGEFDLWMGDMVLTRANRLALLTKSDEARDSILRSAHFVASQMTIGALMFGGELHARDGVRAMLFSPLGIQRLAWYSMRQSNSNVTLPGVAALCEKLPAAEVLVVKILRLSGLWADTADKEDEEPKKEEAADKAAVQT